MLDGEEQTVSFDPMYVCYGGPPWYTLLFRWLILAALLVLVIRSGRMTWDLWRLRTGKAVSLTPTRICEVCESAIARARTLRHLSVLAALLSVLELALTLVGVMDQVAMQKTSGFRAAAGAISGSLAEFSFGMLTCTLLFAFAIIFEGLFSRRRQRTERAGKDAGQDPAESV